MIEIDIKRYTDQNNIKIIEKLNKLVETNIDIIGFCIDRKEKSLEEVQEISNNMDKSLDKYQKFDLLNGPGDYKEIYAKTFMSKNILQLVFDLRVNGWSYKVNDIKSNKYNKYELVNENSEIKGLYNKLIKKRDNLINEEDNYGQLYENSHRRS